MNDDRRKLQLYRYVTWSLLGMGLLALVFTLFVGALPIRLGYLLALIAVVAAVVLTVEMALRRASSRPS